MAVTPVDKTLGKGMATPVVVAPGRAPVAVPQGTPRAPASMTEHGQDAVPKKVERPSALQTAAKKLGATTLAALMACGGTTLTPNTDAAADGDATDSSVPASDSALEDSVVLDDTSVSEDDSSVTPTTDSGVVSRDSGVVSTDSSSTSTDSSTVPDGWTPASRTCFGDIDRGLTLIRLVNPDSREVDLGTLTLANGVVFTLSDHVFRDDAGRQTNVNSFGLMSVSPVGSTLVAAVGLNDNGVCDFSRVTSDRSFSNQSTPTPHHETYPTLNFMDRHPDSGELIMRSATPYCRVVPETISFSVTRTGATGTAHFYCAFSPL